MIIIVDTREQRPYNFASIAPPPTVEVATLGAGDYSLKGYEDQIAIERKSLADAYGTFGAGRKRFEQELERLAQLKFAMVIVEASLDTIIRRPPLRSRLLPKTVVASMIAWTQRFGVHFWACDNRALAEKITFRSLERFWKDRQNEQQVAAKK
jgi:DNA excision repair protein ERCC-4